MSLARADREYGPWLGRFAQIMRPGLVTLELGCGLGDDAAELAEAGLRLTGLDRDLARARAAAGRVPAADFVVADLAASLPFQDATFELVIASLSLHYFDRTTSAAIVAEVARVLRDGGRMLARVNAAGDRRSGYGSGVEREPDVFEVAPGHLKRFFRPDSLRSLLAPAFVVEALVAEETTSRYQGAKRTLVVQARRRPARPG